MNDQGAVFNLDTPARIRWPGRQPRAARELHRHNLGPRLGIVGRVTDRTVVRARLRPRLDREGRDHDAVHDAGVPVPADRVAAHAGQRPARVPARAGTQRRPIPPTPDAGLGQGVFAVDRDLGSGYVQQWNASVQRELRRTWPSRLPTPDRRSRASAFPTRTQPADGRPARAGRAPAAARPESLLRRDPAVVVARRPDDPGRAVAQALPAVHDGQPLPQQRRHDHLPRRYVKLEQRLSHGLSYLVSYTWSKLIDDASSVFDASILTGPVANYPGRRQLQPPARTRLLDGRHSARLRRISGVGPAVRSEPAVRPGRWLGAW